MQIAPRSFSQVITEGMTMLSRVWKKVLVPVFGAIIPVVALTLVVFRWTGANEFLNLVFNEPLVLSALPREELFELALPYLWASLIATLLLLIASAFINLTTHRLVGAELASSPISGGTASRFALTRLVPLLLARLLGSIGVTIGFLLLIAPGIWLAVMLAMTPQVLALEDVGVIGSLRRSFQLVQRQWWPTIGFLLLVGLLGSATVGMIQIVAVPLLFIGNISAALGFAFVFGVLLEGLLISAIAVMTTFWYIALRARKEPLLSESLG